MNKLVDFAAFLFIIAGAALVLSLALKVWGVI